MFIRPDARGSSTIRRRAVFTLTDARCYGKARDKIAR